MAWVKGSWFANRMLVAILMAPLAATQAAPEAWSATQSEILRTCESCHGARGDSQVTTTPRLNGQQAGYMADRLKKLSNATRTNPHAKIGMFKELAGQSDATRLAIANYFSRQLPTSPKPGARAAEGQQIYQKGSVADNVIACNQCHGEQGEGHDTTPRLSGQHADYLKGQLRLFNLKFREHVLMKPNTKTMTDSTMEALASYLAND